MPKMIVAVVIGCVMMSACSNRQAGYQTGYPAPVYPVTGDELNPVGQINGQQIRVLQPQPQTDGDGDGNGEIKVLQTQQTQQTQTQEVNNNNNSQGEQLLVTKAIDKTPVTRQTMVGAWTVSTTSANCQIFLALTKWSGGFRAASRGCITPILADIQAWDVQQDAVLLVNSNGIITAKLYRTGPERFDGATTNAQAISFSR